MGRDDCVQRNQSELRALMHKSLTLFTSESTVQQAAKAELVAALKDLTAKLQTVGGSDEDIRSREHVDMVLTLVQQASEARATTLAMMEEAASQLDLDLTQQELERSEREAEKKREQAAKLAEAQRRQAAAAAKLVRSRSSS